jgi:hypothetical protein
MGAAGRRRAQERFTARAMAEKISEIYLETVGGDQEMRTSH